MATEWLRQICLAMLLAKVKCFLLAIGLLQRDHYRRVLAATIVLACGCGSDPGRSTKEQGAVAQAQGGPSDDTCATAWIDAVVRRAHPLSSASARTPEREAAARGHFLEDCRMLPESVQRCLVKSYAAQDPERCVSGKAQVELHETFRRRCPEYQTVDDCLWADCAWTRSEQRCNAP